MRKKDHKTKWDKDAVKFSDKNHKLIFSMTDIHPIITQGLFIEGCFHAERKTINRVIKELDRITDDYDILLTDKTIIMRILTGIIKDNTQ